MHTKYNLAHNAQFQLQIANFELSELDVFEFNVVRKLSLATVPLLK